jgi:hypothetical protein
MVSTDYSSVDRVDKCNLQWRNSCQCKKTCAYSPPRGHLVRRSLVKMAVKVMGRNYFPNQPLVVSFLWSLFLSLVS